MPKEVLKKIREHIYNAGNELEDAKEQASAAGDKAGAKRIEEALEKVDNLGFEEDNL